MLCGGGLLKLDVSACDITDATLDAVAIHCKRLRRLDVSGCPVTDEALLRVVAGCTELHTLGSQSPVREELDRRVDARRCP